MIPIGDLETNDDFDITKVETGLTAKAKEIMDILANKIYIIDDIIDEGKRRGQEIGDPEYYKTFYHQFYYSLIYQLLHGFEHKEFREHPVYFKFHNDDNEQLKSLEFRYFVANVAFWYPIITVEPEILNDEHIVTKAMGRKINTSFIAGYMNKHYAKPYAKIIDYRTRSETFADTNFLLMRIPLKFNSFLGLSISIEEIRDMAKRMPDFEKGLYVQIDETKQPAEQEEQKKAYDKAQIKRIEEDEVLTTIRAMVGPKAVKTAQLAEFISIIGNKPDEYGKTIPTPINNNYLTGNLASIPKYYINNISGRKAAVINHEYMGTAGHVLISTALLTSSAKLSRTVDDCRTANLIPIWITTDTHLKKLEGRRFKRNSLEMKFSIIDYDRDKELIGQMVWIRSPITCAAHDGICKECYGELYYTNKDLYSVGAYAAFHQLQPLVQGLLSAKHFQGTSSKMIDFGEDFDKYLIMATTDIILNPDLEDMDQYSLVIEQKDIVSSDYIDEVDDIGRDAIFGGNKKKKKKDMQEEEDEYSNITDDELEYRLNYYTSKFYIVKNLHSKKKDMIEVTQFLDPNTRELYMHDDLLMRMSVGTEDLGFDGDYLYLDFADISFEEYVFMVDVKNNELTVPMHKMKELINNTNHAGANTYEEMAQMMLDLTIESGFDASSVHGEIILRQLVRRRVNQQLRPNFERVVTKDDYIVLSVLTALKQNPSFSISMSSSYLKYQLIQMTSTFDKQEPSDLDWWYRRRLAIDEDKLYHGVETI